MVSAPRAKKGPRWNDALMQLRAVTVNAVALANEIAHIIWSLPTAGEAYCHYSGALCSVCWSIFRALRTNAALILLASM